MNSDFKELLHLFNANRVEYLIIGGYAFSHYLQPRYTKDLDIWIRASNENSHRVYKALADFGAPLGELAPADFTEHGTFYMMGVPPARVDILMSIPGLAFEEAWPRRVEATWGNEKAVFISKDDLTRAKEAAGRERDILDAKLLRDSLRWEKKKERER